MKTIAYPAIFRSGLFAAALGITATNAATILAVDFHQHATADVAELRFVGWAIAPDTEAPSSTTIGSYTVTVAAGPTPTVFDGEGAIRKNARARQDSARGKMENLLRERLAATGSAPSDLDAVEGIENGLLVRVEGLKPSTTYELQVWGVDWTTTQEGAGSATAKPGYNAIFDYTRRKPKLLGSYSIDRDVTEISDGEAFSVTANIRSDSTGTIVFKSISNMDGSGIANGFVLRTTTKRN